MGPVSPLWRIPKALHDAKRSDSKCLSPGSMASAERGPAKTQHAGDVLDLPDRELHPAEITPFFGAEPSGLHGSNLQFAYDGALRTDRSS